MRNRPLLTWSVSALAVAVMLVGALTLIWYLKQDKHEAAMVTQPLLPVLSELSIQNDYDVIVAGTDPEGITAAISAARNGLKVLLIDGHNRDKLGGLMTIGELNTLDLNYSPSQSFINKELGKQSFLNNGIFLEWFKQVEGSSFDINTAANVFYRMVKEEPNIDLQMKVQKMTPIIEQKGASGKTVIGMHIVDESGAAKDIYANTVIDATQDADIAAAAGASFTIGREDIGSKSDLMVATLVFRMKGVTPEIWNELAHYKDAGSDKMSIWGYDEAKNYPSSDPKKVKLRGLNIGRQNDGSILINAMQLFNIDPLDPQSVAQGVEIGQKEAPLIANYLKSHFDGFKNLEYAGTANELYIRESRHLIGEYRLKLKDLMENKDFWDAIAYGSYPIDIQSISSGGSGTVLMKPKQYGVPFRTLVPKDIDGLLVVGRSASFDTIPHGSARVIPLGMATGQAAGAAVKIAKDNGITLRELSKSEPLIDQLKKTLVKQGMDLTMNKIEAQDYEKHKDFNGLVAAASMYLTSGGYKNDSWKLDEPTNIQRYLNQLRQVRKFHADKLAGDPYTAVDSIQDPIQKPLTLTMAASMLTAMIGNEQDEQHSVDYLLKKGWLKQETIDSITDPAHLTNGDAYQMLYDLSVSLMKLEF
ncbi:FAD-dependent oxidoreductase [Paenibacillus protaetiae]|uniref:FAD-dependent oxidoreductase n=1 Tax=Paenibacillus protaetiae TaxID=2509456 RepID=UPI001FC94282|nr:FAD-dependent oxidoreductase [Paenibacillus protaetiae]